MATFPCKLMVGGGLFWKAIFKLVALERSTPGPLGSIPLYFSGQGFSVAGR
jgi:hypothetical protein